MDVDDGLGVVHVERSVAPNMSHVANRVEDQKHAWRVETSSKSDSRDENDRRTRSVTLYEIQPRLKTASQDVWKEGHPVWAILMSSSLEW